MPPEYSIARLFNTVSREVGDGISEDKMAQCEQILYSVVRNRASRGHFPWMRAVLVGVPAILLTVVLLFLSFKDGSPLLFSVGEKGVAGVTGEWLSTGSHETISLRFEQGSTVFVYPKSTVRLRESTEQSVTVNLKSGSLFADIKGNGHTRWSVDTGPYRVTVLGTKFHVTWNRKDHLFDVKVDKGTVLVQGQGIEGQGVQVSQGKHFRADPRTGFFAVKSVEGAYDPTFIAITAEGTEGSGPDNRPAPPREDSISGHALSPHGAPPRPSEKGDAPAASERDKAMPPAPKAAGGRGIPPAKARWLAQYQRGRFDLAVEEAEAAGIGELLLVLRADALWKLAHAARISGRVEIAKKALLACRDRFSGTQHARSAAFLLGKIHADQEGASFMASEWFRTYLSEDPEGLYAEEALGRLVVTEQRLGRQRTAAGAARSYLAKYPNGAFEANARSVLGD